MTGSDYPHWVSLYLALVEEDGMIALVSKRVEEVSVAEKNSTNHALHHFSYWPYQQGVHVPGYFA